MGAEKDMNKVLSNIYTDLEKLQNARTQVEIVTENATDLTNSTAVLVKELKEFSNKIGDESSGNISQLTESIEAFENKINNISDKGNRSLTDYIDSLKKQTAKIFDDFALEITKCENKLNAVSDQNIEKLNASLNNFDNRVSNITEKGNESLVDYIKTFKEKIVSVIDQFSKQIDLAQESFQEINNLNNEKISEKIGEFERITKELAANAANTIKEIQTSAIDKIERQEKIIAETIASIKETNSKAENLVKVLGDYNIPNTLESINQKLVVQKKANKTNRLLLIIAISLIGIAGVISIVF